MFTVLSNYPGNNTTIYAWFKIVTFIWGLICTQSQTLN